MARFGVPTELPLDRRRSQRVRTQQGRLSRRSLLSRLALILGTTLFGVRVARSPNDIVIVRGWVLKVSDLAGLDIDVV